MVFVYFNSGLRLIWDIFETVSCTVKSSRSPLSRRVPLALGLVVHSHTQREGWSRLH